MFSKTTIQVNPTILITFIAIIIVLHFLENLLLCFLF